MCGLEDSIRGDSPHVLNQSLDHAAQFHAHLYLTEPYGTVRL
jgi:hypothetical protein